MIPNHADVRAVFTPANFRPYTLPVVAWNDKGTALVPTAEGGVIRAAVVPGFARLERDVRFTDDGQEAFEEDLADVTAGPAPIKVPEDRRPRPTAS